MEIRAINDESAVENKIKKAIESLDNLKNTPRSQEYEDMMQFHKNELIDISENAAPWEWSYGLDFLVEHLRWMRDYYKLGENVWGMEERDEDPKRNKKVPTRLETLEKTLYYYDKWQNLESEYIQVINTGPMKWRDNEDGTSTLEDIGAYFIYKYGPKNNQRRAMLITYKKLHKAQQKYKKLFFKMLYKYQESWWD